MAVHLSHNAYGKHRVRVSKIRRSGDDPARHEFIEATVNVIVQGDLAAGYTDGDNSGIVATDTCKNTVYAIAKDDPMVCIETFGVRLAEHFLAQYAHLDTATITIGEKRWHRLLDCPHAFLGNDSEIATIRAIARRGEATTLTAGVDQLVIAKTTASGFANFHRDEYRTLADTDDRIMATSVTADWSYDAMPDDFVAARHAIRDAMLRRFIDHTSVSVQQTLFFMAQAALAACDQIGSITLTMPNKHHIPVNLEPLGRANQNEVFIVTDEPFGFITATIDRTDASRLG